MKTEKNYQNLNNMTKTKYHNTQGQIRLHTLTIPTLTHVTPSPNQREEGKTNSSRKGNTKPLINKLEFINAKPISQKLRQGFSAN